MRPLIPALAASVLVAAAVVWTPLPGPSDPAGDPPAGPGAVGPQAAVVPSRAVAFVKFAPLAATGDSAAGAAPKPGPPVLVGLAGAGRARTAYIMDAGSPVRARVGDKIGKWRLTSIGPHSITLRGPGKSMQLAFYGPREAPRPVAAPEAPPTAAAASKPAAAPTAAAAPPPPPPVQPRALEPAFRAGRPRTAAAAWEILEPTARPARRRPATPC